MKRQRKGLESNFWLSKSFGLKERRGGGEGGGNFWTQKENGISCSGEKEGEGIE